jgi:hypothetical protein
VAVEVEEEEVQPVEALQAAGEDPEVVPLDLAPDPVLQDPEVLQLQA